MFTDINYFSIWTAVNDNYFKVKLNNFEDSAMSNLLFKLSTCDNLRNGEIIPLFMEIKSQG